MTPTEKLSPLFWLWLPLAVITAQLVCEFALPRDFMSQMQSENGPHELFEFLLLLSGFIVALMTLTRLNWKTQKPLAVWVLIAAVCCFYVGGEEISWGQQILH